MSDEVETTTETITLTQHMLGMTPYTLIELREASDGSGEPALFVEAGGGAEEDPLAMPLLAISEQRAKDSTVAQMLREVYQATGPTSTGEGVVEKIVREFNPDWLPFVLGS